MMLGALVRTSASRCEAPTLNVSLPVGRHATAELRVERDVVGPVDQVDDDGERSWMVTLVVLQDDLRG